MALLHVCGGAPSGRRLIATSSATRVTIVAEENERHTTNGEGEGVGLVTLNVAPTTVGSESVVAMTTSRRGQLLAAVTSEKRLVVWEQEECGEWRVKRERSVAKRVTALQISEDEQYLLTADKTGTVTRYRLLDVSCNGEEMMGHLSMILDMVMVSRDSHVITCDRDEKIRVSRYPNCYNIETYCLGHTEFVSCLCLCEKWPCLLISASGDGTVRSWEWRKGRLLDTHHCSQEGEFSSQEPVAVTRVVCSRNMDKPLIVATLERSSELVVLQLSSEGRFKRSPAVVSLPASPWCCEFDWSDRLWVCLPHEQDPVQCWLFEEGKFQRCSTPLQEQLSNWDLFRECGEGVEWSSLRKTTVDNMTEYLARKEERMRLQRDSPANSLTSPLTTADEKPPQPPPEKKMKTQTMT